MYLVGFSKWKLRQGSALSLVGQAAKDEQVGMERKEPYNIMSRQYLKQLKERAQRLLDRSSDEEEEEEEINAYTATQGTRSPQRIILDQPPLSGPQEVSEFYQHDTTDIEMLKRCIALTNQNNNLKFLVEKLSAQVDSLKNDLRISVQNESVLRKRLESKEATADKKEDSRLQQLMQMIETERKQLQRQRIALKVKQEELNREQAQIRHQRQQSNHQQTRQKVTKRQRIKEEGSQIEVHNDYTIRTHKRDDYERLKIHNQQLQRRIGRLEGVVRQQRSKANRLCKFISKEVPALNAIIVQLTAKLDAKFQKRILNQLAL